MASIICLLNEIPKVSKWVFENRTNLADHHLARPQHTAPPLYKNLYIKDEFIMVVKIPELYQDPRTLSKF